MDLDQATLVTVSLTVGLALAVNMTVLYVLVNRPHSLRLWAMAFWALAVGTLLAQQFGARSAWVLVVANLLVSIANALILVGVLHHFDRAVRWRYPLLLVAGYAIALTYVFLLAPTAFGQEVVFAIHSIIWDAWIIWVLVRLSPPTLRVSSGLTALVFIADLVFYGLAGLLAMDDPGGRHAAAEKLLMSSKYLFGTIATMMLAVGLMTMVVQKVMQALRQAAERDGLTGAPNRATFARVARRRIARCNQAHQPYVLILCDLDYFKRVNDRYGHGGGDAALGHFVELLRELGLPRKAFYSRYGGEEFAILLPNMRRAEAMELAERLRTRTEQSRLDYQDEQIRLTVSMSGVEALAVDYEQAIHAADVALYAAKDGVVIASYSLTRRALLPGTSPLRSPTPWPDGID